MNLVLVGKRKILFEKSKRSNDLTVMYVPNEENIQVFHDMQGNRTDYEVASRAGSPDKKPIWRDVAGKIVLFGWVPDELTGRTSSMRIWLAQDFLPEDATIFYFAVGSNHLVHGRKEVDDEQKTSWRVTTLQTSSVEEVISLIKTSLIDQLMTGENQVPCIAVYQDPALQTKIDEDLKHLQVKSQPLEKLSPAYRQIRPLYKQRNHTLILLVMMLFFFLVLLASAVFWIFGMVESKRQEKEIEGVQYAIQNIQINERIGYIKAPEEIQEKIKSLFNQLPSSFMDAALRIGANFGDLSKIKFSLEPGQANTFSVGTEGTVGVYPFTIETSSLAQPMLVDQESIAKDLVAKTPWLRRIDNLGDTGRNGLSILMKIQVEETPEMEANRGAQGAAATPPAAVPPVSPTEAPLTAAPATTPVSASVSAATAISGTENPSPTNIASNTVAVSATAQTSVTAGVPQ